MKNEQLTILETQLNDLVTRVTDFESRAMRQGQQANEEFSVFKNDLQTLKSELDKIKRELNSNGISNSDLELFGTYVRQYLESVIDEFTETDYNPEINDANFDIRYGNEVYLSSVDVSTHEIKRDIENSIDFANLLDYIDTDNSDFRKGFVETNFDFLKEIFDRIEEAFNDELPNGFYTLDNVEDFDMEIEYNDYDKYLNLNEITIQFGSLITDNMQDIDNIVDEVLANYYSEESPEESSEEN